MSGIALRTQDPESLLGPVPILPYQPYLSLYLNHNLITDIQMAHC